MKILHLLSNRWYSAITEYALSAASALRLQGCENVFVPLAGSPAEKKSQAKGLITVPFDRFSPSQFRNMRRLIDELKPDVVMTYGGPETSLVRIAGFGASSLRAKVVRFRGHEIDSNQLLFSERQRLGHAHCSLIVTPALSMAETLRSVVSCPVEAVQLGVDENRFQFLPETPRTAELVVLGRLDPVKGHQDFMKRFRWLKACYTKRFPSSPPLLLHIVGEPANLSEIHLRKFANEAGLVEGLDYKITASRVEDIARLMSQTLLGVIPSIGSEVICRVAEEFLLCGTPVAVSGAGNLKDVLKHNSFGFCWADQEWHGELFGQKGQPSFAAAVETAADAIYRYSQESIQERQNRRQLALQQFSLASMGLRLHNLLQQITR